MMPTVPPAPAFMPAATPFSTEVEPLRNDSDAVLNEDRRGIVTRRVSGDEARWLQTGDDERERARNWSGTGSAGETGAGATFVGLPELRVERLTWLPVGVGSAE